MFAFTSLLVSLRASSWAVSNRKVCYNEALHDKVEIEERIEENGILIA